MIRRTLDKELLMEIAPVAACSPPPCRGADIFDQARDYLDDLLGRSGAAARMPLTDVLTWVYQDEGAPLDLRVEAAAALLPYTHGYPADCAAGAKPITLGLARRH
jgi:hypothetical protein